MVPSTGRDEKITSAGADAGPACTIAEVACELPDGIRDGQLGQHFLVVTQDLSILIRSCACPQLEAHLRAPCWSAGSQQRLDSRPDG